MSTVPFELAICADMFFTDLPFLDRLRRISDAGFAVEFWGWTDRDPDAVAGLASVRVAAFNGYIGGSMVHPDGAAAFLDGVRKTIPIAKTLGVRELFLTTGEMGHGGRVAHPVASDPATRAITAYRLLCEIANLAEQNDLVYSLENLNTKVDHPGYALPHVSDVLALIDGVGSPRIRILLDLYHAQVEEGNLIELVRLSGQRIGHVQVADVPGRHEPGTGEVNYAAVAAELRNGGYSGVVGLEAFPSEMPELAMRRFRETFQSSI